MARYQITWSVDANGENPLEALRTAIERFPHQLQENEFGAPTMFDVTELQPKRQKGTTHRIDVMDDGCNPFNDEDVKEFKGEFADSHLLLRK